MAAKQQAVGANENQPTMEVSPLSKELVIGVVGYAGAGCSTTAKRLEMLLVQAGYTATIIKLSELIAKHAELEAPIEAGGANLGQTKFDRAGQLQDAGDALRSGYGGHAVSQLAITEIMARRGEGLPGAEKRAYILDSIKHADEIHWLRRVYEHSFRLVAVHCERLKREARLIGSLTSVAKYRGVDESSVQKYMDRDEKDHSSTFGQQVRDAFYLGDFFIDNNGDSQEGVSLNNDLDRFLKLLLEHDLVRPTSGERAMYHAYAAALQSSCLSRQVGAALVSSAGALIATGTNDVPKFGGGIYDEEASPDHRCSVWEWTSGELKFTGCHNDRKKVELREKIGAWLAEEMSEELALAAHPIPDQMDTARLARSAAAVRIKEAIKSGSKKFEAMPGIRELIEYSRSIHAEMDALFSAARSGVSPVGATLYCTTYPCHSCARHLVTAGVTHVFYIEPYVKSLASELHYDAISTVKSTYAQDKPGKMAVLPFTGVGPRMYEDFFAKRGELKSEGGAYVRPSQGVPTYAVRLRELAGVEEVAAKLQAVTGGG